jgi:hypothetical protein
MCTCICVCIRMCVYVCVFKNACVYICMSRSSNAHGGGAGNNNNSRGNERARNWLAQRSTAAGSRGSSRSTSVLVCGMPL